MSKKEVSVILSTSLAVVLALAMAVAGCAKGPSTPTKTKKSPAAKKPIELVAATYIPPSYTDLFPQEPEFVKRVNKNEKVNVKFYPSGKLLKAKELLPGLEKGTADLIFLTGSYVTGTWPIWNGFATPFLWKDCIDVWNSVKQGTPLRNFLDKRMAEKHGIKVVGIGPVPLEHLWLKGKSPATKPGDVKGLKIRAAGKMESRTIKALGGSPVRMPSSEAHEALSRGTVDGIMCYAGTVGARSLYEVLGSCTRTNFGAYGGVPIWMKMDTFEKLPEDVQDTIMEAGKKYDYKNPRHALKVHKNKFWPKFRESGMNIKKKLSPEEIKAFRKATKPVRDWYKKQVGTKTAEKFYRLARK